MVDKAGRPVSGLEKSDFTLLEDGRPQPIVAFEERRLAQPGSGDEQVTSSDGLTATNEHPAARQGRTFAFVLDRA